LSRDAVRFTRRCEGLYLSMNDGGTVALDRSGCRRQVGSATVATLAITLLSLRPAVTHADVLSIYVQGHGGMSGDMQGATSGSDGTGAALGVEAGAKLLFFDGYVDYDALLPGGTVLRTIVGTRIELTLYGFRLALRAGGGLRRASASSPESAFVTRTGVALDRKISDRLLVGLGIDGELAYALSQPGQMPPKSDVVVALRVTYQLGR
jgi:hypothetical protein